MAMLDDAEIGKRFDRHRQTESTVPAFELVHAAVKVTASVLNQALPAGRKAALALTALEEALMHADGAVACDTGPEWQLPDVDVAEELDELTELVEGPLHIRSRSVGGGGPVAGPSGGDIGPDVAENGPIRAGRCCPSKVPRPGGAVRSCDLTFGHAGAHVARDAAGEIEGYWS